MAWLEADMIESLIANDSVGQFHAPPYIPTRRLPRSGKLPSIVKPWTYPFGFYYQEDEGIEEEKRKSTSTEAEITFVMQQTIDKLLQDSKRQENLHKIARKIFEGKATDADIPGVIKSFPGWKDYVTKSAGKILDSYFIATLGVLGNIAWETYPENNRAVYHNQWRPQAKKFWDEKDIYGLLSQISNILPDNVKNELAKLKPPEGVKMPGINLGQIILLAGIGIGGFFLVKNILKR